MRRTAVGAKTPQGSLGSPPGVLMGCPSTSQPVPSARQPAHPVPTRASASHSSHPSLIISWLSLWGSLGASPLPSSTGSHAEDSSTHRSTLPFQRWENTVGQNWSKATQSDASGGFLGHPEIRGAPFLAEPKSQDPCHFRSAAALDTERLPSESTGTADLGPVSFRFY